MPGPRTTEASMKIMVSACLLGQNCKYNGGNNYSEKVAEYIKGYEVIPVCPEVAGGLPTSRIPCEIVNGVVTNKQMWSPKVPDDCLSV